MADSFEPQELAVGTMVDHFRIRRLLGRGGMGEVYLARDTRLGRSAALKILHPEDLGDPRAVERCLAEARTIARFSHPHIVAIYAVGQHEGRPYLALEYLKGESLRERMSRESISAREAVHIALAIGEALAEAHRNHVLHRDLKPENVLLPNDGRLRVVDFGLAKVVCPREDDIEELRTRRADGRRRRASDGAGRALATSAGDMGGEGCSESSEASDGRLEKHLTTARGLVGTPAYMSPEQWKEQECSQATDMWSFGVIVYELLCGRRPVSDSANPLVFAMRVCETGPLPSVCAHRDVAEPLAALVDGCLSKDPSARPTAERAVQTLRRLARRHHVMAGAETNPFRGLLPFDESHAEFFFGRQEEVASLVERMRREPVLPVVGPSGAGKSSLVAAGLIPRLRDQARWQVLSMRPGARPFHVLASRIVAAEQGEAQPSFPHPRSDLSPDPELTEALLKAGRDERSGEPGEKVDESADPVSRLARSLRERPGLLALHLQRLARMRDCRVLLFVDQLEEVDGVSEESERYAFMEALGSAADDPNDPVRVVFTLRDDFLGRLAVGPQSAKALATLAVIRPPGVEQLRRIITSPLDAVGYDYGDEGLVDDMIAEVRDEPACLPLLQFTCHSLWARRDRKSRTIGRAAYDAVGGVAGALARHADGVLDGLTEAQMRAARQMLLRLVTPAHTRKTLSARHLLEGLGEPGEIVLERLINERLVVVRRSENGGRRKSSLELAHEALITGWRRLSHWIEESRDDLAFLDEVGQAAELWKKRGCRDEEVWTGEALSDAERSLDRCATEPPADVRGFLAAGRKKQDRTRKARRAAAIGGLLALCVVAAGAVVFSFVVTEKNRQVRSQRDLARAERRRAEREHGVSEREGARAALARGDLLEARARLRSSVERVDSPLSRALWYQLSKSPLRWKRRINGGAYDVSFSPDGRVVALVGRKPTVHLFDAVSATGRVLRGPPGPMVSVAFAGSSRRVVAGCQNGELRIWSLSGNQQSGNVTPRVIAAHRSPVWGLAVSPDGRLAATGARDRKLKLWDLASGKLIVSLPGHRKTIARVVFGAKGKRIASASMDGTIRIWDVEAKTCRRVLKNDGSALSDVAMSPDGRLVAGGDIKGNVPVWEVATGEVVRVLEGHSARVNGVDFNRRGDLIASGSLDHTVRIWSLETGRCRRVIRGHGDTVWSVAFGPGSDVVASCGSDQTLRLWDPSAASPRQSPCHHAEAVGVAFLDGGERLVSGSYDRDLIIWDSATGEPRRQLQGHTGKIVGVAATPRKNLLASASQDGTVRLWDPESGEPVRAYPGKKGKVKTVAISPDGRLVAAAGSGEVTIWESETGKLRATFSIEKESIWGLAFSPGSELIAAGCWSGEVSVWDLATTRLVATLKGHDKAVRALCFQGLRRLVTASWDSTLTVWDLERGRSSKKIDLPAPANGVVCRRDRSGLAGIAVALRDGTLRLLDSEGKVAKSRRAHRGDANWVACDPDGARLATSGDDGTVRVWTTDGKPYWWAPGIVSRPARLFSHRGVTNLDEQGGPRGPASSWERLLVSKAARVAESSDGSTICVLTHSGVLAAYRAAEPNPKNLARTKVFDPSGEGVYSAQLQAIRRGCLLLHDGEAKVFDLQGAARLLSSEATALGGFEDRVVMATPKGVSVIDLGSGRRTLIPTAGSITALNGTGEGVMVGYRDGSLELVALGRARQGVLIDDGPVASTTCLLPVERSVIAAGFSNGEVGLWSATSGRRLLAAKLHGPVSQLRLIDRKLYAATDLGDSRTFDLDVFYWDHNTFVETVRSNVAVRWEEGRVVRP